jgi:hypothetical protein
VANSRGEADDADASRNSESQRRIAELERKIDKLIEAQFADDEKDPPRG